MVIFVCKPLIFIFNYLLHKFICIQFLSILYKQAYSWWNLSLSGFGLNHPFEELRFFCFFIVCSFSHPPFILRSYPAAWKCSWNPVNLSIWMNRTEKRGGGHLSSIIFQYCKKAMMLVWNITHELFLMCHGITKVRGRGMNYFWCVIALQK